MKLRRVQITEFQSIRDTTPFEIGNITCLVGKNESGKTSILQALYRLNPIDSDDGVFDSTDDYPRADVSKYERAVAAKKRMPATVVRATFVLDESEMASIAEELGASALLSNEIVLSKRYDQGEDELSFQIATDEAKSVRHLIDQANLHPDIVTKLAGAKTAAAAVAVLDGAEEGDAVASLALTLAKIVKRGVSGYVYDTYIAALVPRFVYFSEYYQMRGRENIEALQQRQQSKQLQPSDHPMLGLVELAEMSLDELLNPQRTQELVNKLEGAGNHLSRQVLKYWSQNKHLQMRFDVRPALRGDPEGMRSGTNIWASVYDSRHMVTTNLGARSQGFVWFFSFLAWYSQLQRDGSPLILLLDEPGLSLHAKAQLDLLRYFEAELGPEHQLIYTTHSPFMVDPTHWERVRIVQDKSIDTLDTLPEDEDGTKVFTDVLKASDDSLFPLQGALGYEIHQSLFIGPNNLIVEGVSDLLYLQAMTAVLQRKGRIGLSDRWTITPVGGAEKVPTFVALIGAQRTMTLATLIDIDQSNEQEITQLYARKLLAKKRVLTYADFTTTKYADVEDMFEVPFYLDLVNEEYGVNIHENDLTDQRPRVITRLEAFIKDHPLPNSTPFNHYRPARLFAEKAGQLIVPDATLDRFEKAFVALNALLPDE
jgi:predicted ATP-dependent endonuclease of OLD family